MRTLFLLAALLLVAFQVRAKTLQETADQVPAQDQPEAKDQDLLGAQDQDQAGAEDQDQAGAEDQDIAITITGEERLTQEALAFQRRIVCICRSSLFCGLFERLSGSCVISGRRYRLCCR